MLWGLVLVSLLASLLTLGVATASPPKMAVVVPDLPYFMASGYRFTVEIRVYDVLNLWGYQFWLAFNPEVLHGVKVENGPFLGSAGSPVLVAPGPGFDNEVGELKLFGAVIFFTGEPPHNKYLPDGDGLLATVTFEVVGNGCSDITLGPESALADKWGEPMERTLEHGSLCNPIGPELYVRRRGAHGSSGNWPEWTVGIPCSTQTLFCKVRNYGEIGAWVEAAFVVVGPVGIEIYPSNQDWVPPRASDGTPGEVTVSASFHVAFVGKYDVSVKLYFKAGPMPEKELYSPYEDALGGEGSSWAKSSFKVQEQL